MRKEENEKKGKYDKKKARKKCTKKTKIVMPRFELTPLNNVLKQNVKVTKPARFATYYSPYKYRRQFVLTAVAKMKHNRKAILPRLIINAPHGSNFMTTPDFTSVAEKTSRYRKVILAVGKAL